MMNAREKIYSKLSNFQNNEKLEIKTFSSNYENSIEEFIKNATLAGAIVYSKETEIKNFKPENYTDSFSFEATIGVAENGALWCSDLGDFRERLFSRNDLILTIKSSNIVGNMHEAYDKIDLSSKQFGTFIAGPSKTADIEQSLVIGAHGAMQLHILLLNT